MNCIGERIRAIRKDANLAQKEFGARLAITQSHISGIELGKFAPSDSLLRLICLEYGVNEGWLKNGIGDKTDPFYNGENENDIEDTFLIAIEGIKELLATKSNVKRVYYSSLLQTCIILLMNNGLEEDKYILYLDELCGMFADFERIRSFLPTILRNDNNDKSETKNATTTIEQYAKMLAESFYSVVKIYKGES